VHRSLFGIGKDAGPLALPFTAADVAA